MTPSGESRANPPLDEVDGVVFGVAVAGRLPAGFAAYLQPRDRGGEEPASTLRVRFERVEAPPADDEIWAMEPTNPKEARFGLHRRADGFGLTVASEGHGFFLCNPSEIRIGWTAAETDTAAYHFFSHALPLWLEWRGEPLLHGSSVVFGERAVGFLGSSGSGKSLLAMELDRLGCAVLADDALVLRRDGRGSWRTFPGPPLVRLWPSGLDRLGLVADGLQRVREAVAKRHVPARSDAGRSQRGLPLAALYLLERRTASDGPATVSPAPPREALVRLLEHGVAAEPVAALGLAARRFELLGDVVEAVPVRRLDYPSGPRAAARVRRAIDADLG